MMALVMMRNQYPPSNFSLCLVLGSLVLFSQVSCSAADGYNSDKHKHKERDGEPNKFGQQAEEEDAVLESTDALVQPVASAALQQQPSTHAGAEQAASSPAPLEVVNTGSGPEKVEDIGASLPRYDTEDDPNLTLKRLRKKTGGLAARFAQSLQEGEPTPLQSEEREPPSETTTPGGPPVVITPPPGAATDTPPPETTKREDATISLAEAEERVRDAPMANPEAGPIGRSGSRGSSRRSSSRTPATPASSAPATPAGDPPATAMAGRAPSTPAGRLRQSIACSGVGPPATAAPGSPPPTASGVNPDQLAAMGAAAGAAANMAGRPPATAVAGGAPSTPTSGAYDTEVDNAYKTAMDPVQNSVNGELFEAAANVAEQRFKQVRGDYKGEIDQMSTKIQDSFTSQKDWVLGIKGVNNVQVIADFTDEIGHPTTEKIGENDEKFEKALTDAAGSKGFPNEDWKKGVAGGGSSSSFSSSPATASLSQLKVD